jgi:hypothetical protein
LLLASPTSDEAPRGGAAAPATKQPARSRARWTPAEVADFERALALHGPHRPSLIAADMGGARTSEQVRERIKWSRKKLQQQQQYGAPVQHVQQQMVAEAAADDPAVWG